MAVDIYSHSTSTQSTPAIPHRNRLLKKPSLLVVVIEKQPYFLPRECINEVYIHIRLHHQHQTLVIQLDI